MISPYRFTCIAVLVARGATPEEAMFILDEVWPQFRFKEPTEQNMLELFDELLSRLGA